MTPALVPLSLAKVHLMVAVEGHLLQKWFHASPNLAYSYIWDKTDAYRQRVHGLTEALGKWDVESRNRCILTVILFLVYAIVCFPVSSLNLSSKTQIVS